MAYPIDPDEDLIRDAQFGSEKAFNELVRKHYRAVHRISFRIIGHFEEARDVAQEVFYQLHRMLPQWKYKAKLFTWLYSTTLNLSRNVKRKGSKLSYVENIFTEVKDGEFKSADQSIIEDEKKQALNRYLNKLPARQHQVIILRVYEQLSVDDTAEIMQCKAGTVKSLLFQALSRLSKEMNKESIRHDLSS